MRKSRGRIKQVWPAVYAGYVNREERSVRFLARLSSDSGRHIEVSIPRSRLEGLLEALHDAEREFREQDRLRRNAELDRSIVDGTFPALNTQKRGPKMPSNRDHQRQLTN